MPSGSPSPGFHIPESRVHFTEASWHLRPCSTQPEVVTLQANPSTQERAPSTTLSRPKRLGFFSRLGISSPAIETHKVSHHARSIASPGSQGSTLPKYLSFCFSLSGKDLIIWKKDSQALVHIELESQGSRLLDLRDILPAADEVSSVSIRYVAQGTDWICLLLSQNRVCVRH